MTPLVLFFEEPLSESSKQIVYNLVKEIEATEDTLRGAVDALVDFSEQLKDAESTIDVLDAEVGAAHGALRAIYDSLSFALRAQPTGISRVYTRSAVRAAERALGLDPAPPEAHAGNC